MTGQETRPTERKYTDRKIRHTKMMIRFTLQNIRLIVRKIMLIGRNTKSLASRTNLSGLMYHTMIVISIGQVRLGLI